MDDLETARRYFFEALDHHNHDRLEQAEALYRKACELAPERLSVLANLAAVLVRQGCYAEAEAYCARALAVDPEHADTLVNHALCRREAGRPAEALDLLDRVLRERPADAAVHNNRGLILRDMGRYDAALRGFDRALALRGDAPGVLANRGGALAALGKLDEAYDSYRRALSLDPRFAQAQEGFYDLVTAHGYRPAAPTTEFVELAVRAVRGPWGRPKALAPLLVYLLRADPVIQRWLGGGGADSIADHAMLHALLEHVPVPDPDFEQALIGLRRQLLEPRDAHPLALHCALARQCFINEYAYPSEQGQAEPLERRLAAALTDGGADADARDVAALATLMPLHALAGAERLLARDWPAPVAELLAVQVEQPLAERALRARLPRLTPVEDTVSQRVRAQYEAHPYPRWTAAARPSGRQSLDGYLLQRLPGAAFRPLGNRAVTMALNAGCGTGQHPIETAQAIAGVDVLAVDLSLASLAYGARMAAALGVDNIRFAQADILELGALEQRFDLIESAGVLHHMGEPARGLAVLASLLADGGVLRLALYSEAARAPLAEVRRLIAERGHAADPDGIRALRHELLAARHPVAHWPDFYTTSECRDLLFHVQEHRFTIPALAALLAGAGLAFIGFELTPRQRERFQARFPDPADLHELDAWQAFEAHEPDAFSGMYQFWTQRASVALRAEPLL